MKDFIIQILPIVLPFVFGWLLKSPLTKPVIGTGWSGQLLEKLASIDPAIYRTLIDAVQSASGRREVAVQVILQLSDQHDLGITPELAQEFVDYVETLLRAK